MLRIKKRRSTRVHFIFNIVSAINKIFHFHMKCQESDIAYKFLLSNRVIDLTFQELSTNSENVA